jgi:hypothetical protein
MALVLSRSGRPVTSARDPDGGPDAGVLRRLREELVDDAVPLPLDGPLGPALLAELAYARRPPRHEGRAPRYGSLLFGDLAPDWMSAPIPPVVVDTADLAPGLARRMADGRGSFTAVGMDGPAQLVCYPRSFEYESLAVKLAATTGTVVVQRLRNGAVRVCTRDGIVSWDGAEWTFKPLAARWLRPLRRLVPDADPVVAAALLELCVHWLSAGGVGAILVWYLRQPEGNPSRLDLASAVVPPPLDVRQPAQFSALLSLLSQMDRAVTLRPNGQLLHLGALLVPSDEAVRLVPAVGGTRHTSARRFSFDEPDTVVFVVSESGAVTVFSDGAAAAEVRVDPCRSGFPTRLLEVEPDPEDERFITCPACQRLLLFDVVDIPAWTGPPEVLPCPVCRATLELDVYRAAVRGVRKQLPQNNQGRRPSTAPGSM